MVFSAISFSRVSSFEFSMIQMIPLVLGKKIKINDYASLCLIDVIRSRMKTEWEKSYHHMAKLSCSCSQHLHFE